jgi:hypothetical protein
MKISTMKVLVAAGLLLSAMGASAVTVTSGGCNGGTSGLTSCEPGATITTFDNGVMPAGFTNVAGSGGQIVSGTSSTYAAPANDSTDYLAIPSNTSSGTVQFSTGTNQHYFGLYWGSMDDYNTLTFLENGTQVASFTGSQVISDLTLLGNQVATGSNQYVNFYFGTQAYNTVQLSSTNYAYEVDNIAESTDTSIPKSVPEPFVGTLLGLGLLGVVLLRRRSQA